MAEELKPCLNEKWKLLYIKRLIDRGMDEEEAHQTFWAGFDSGEFDFKTDPIDCADDELSYIP